MTTEEAIKEVVGAWGVDPERKLTAIRLLLSGTVPSKEVATRMRELSVAEGASFAAQQDLEAVREDFDLFCAWQSIEVTR